jgi:hypothetical protein
MWCFDSPLFGSRKVRQSFEIYFSWLRRKAYPRGKSPSSSLRCSPRPKAEALGYLEATAEAKKQGTVRAKTEADPCGMISKKTGNCRSIKQKQVPDGVIKQRTGNCRSKEQAITNTTAIQGFFPIRLRSGAG